VRQYSTPFFLNKIINVSLNFCNDRQSQAKCGTVKCIDPYFGDVIGGCNPASKSNQGGRRLDKHKERATIHTKKSPKNYKPTGPFYCTSMCFALLPPLQLSPFTRQTFYKYVFGNVTSVGIDPKAR
jgi:hypothetical protein